MPCYHSRTVDRFGRHIIMHICGNLGPHCAECSDVSENLCDFPVGKDKTCDRHLCHQHSNEIAPDLHYCTAHFKRWLQFEREGGVKESLKNVIPYRAKP